MLLVTCRGELYDVELTESPELTQTNLTEDEAVEAIINYARAFEIETIHTRIPELSVLVSYTINLTKLESLNARRLMAGSGAGEGVQ